MNITCIFSFMFRGTYTSHGLLCLNMIVTVSLSFYCLSAPLEFSLSLSSLGPDDWEHLSQLPLPPCDVAPGLVIFDVLTNQLCNFGTSSSISGNIVCTLGGLHSWGVIANSLFLWCFEWCSIRLYWQCISLMVSATAAESYSLHALCDS